MYCNIVLIQGGWFICPAMQFLYKGAGSYVLQHSSYTRGPVHMSCNTVLTKGGRKAGRERSKKCFRPYAVEKKVHNINFIIHIPGPHIATKTVVY